LALASWRHASALPCAAALVVGAANADDHLSLSNLAIPPQEAATVERAVRLGGDGMDYGRNVFCADDGTCVLFGDTIKSFGKSTDLLAIGLESDGRIEWARTYGGKDKDRICGAAASATDGFLVLSLSESSFFTPLPGDHPSRPLFLRLSTAGAVQWAGTFDGFLGAPEPVAAAEGRDGGWLVVMNRPIGKPFFAKLSASGDVEWSGHLEFPTPAYLVGVTAEGAGGFLCAGRLQETEDTDDIVVLALDAVGRPRWAKVYAADGDQDVWSISPAAGGALVSGSSRGSGAWDILAVAIDANGEVRWSSVYVTEGKEGNEWSTTAVRAASGRTLLCGGLEESDGPSGLLAMIDDAGAVVTSHRATGSARGDLMSAAPLPEGRFLALGSTSGESAKDFDITMWTWNAAAESAPAVNLERRELALEARAVDVKSEPREGLGVPHPFVTLNVKDVSLSGK
jgi:hypothetical protein